MRTGIVHARVVCDQDRMLEDGAVIVEQGRITAVLEAEAVRADMADCFLDAPGLTLTPGWIDIHIHGAGGRDLIEGTAEAVRTVSENVIRDGCTSFIASLTVVSHPQMLSILENLAGCSMDQPGASLLGIHSEGPYLSVQYKALMNEQWLRDPSLEELRQMCEAAQGHLKLMTVAPERPGMPELIEAAVAEGITVMIGHTAATSAQVHQARLCGAAGFTHLYNAMSQHLHRQPGCVTGAFLEKAMAADPKPLCHRVVHCQIGDRPLYRRMGALGMGADVQPSFTASDGPLVAGRLGGREPSCYAWKTMLESGVTVAGGSDSPVEDFNPLWGIHCAVNRPNGAHTPWLPEQCLTPEEAVALYTTASARLAGDLADSGTLEAGKYADLVVLDRDLFTVPHACIKDLTVELTMAGGRITYRRDPSALLSVE